MVFWLIWVAIQVALFVLADLLRPKPDIENAKPAGLGDFQFPTATEGRFIPLIWGTVRQKGPNVVWYGDYLQEAITERVKTGLFTHETITKGFRYHLGMQLALCRMSVDALINVWIGDVQVFFANGVVTASVNTAGTGYRNGEIVTVSGGTYTKAAKLKLKINGPTGAVTDVKIIDHGVYTTFPSGTVGVVGGSGSGFTASLTYGSEITHGQTFAVDCPELFGGDELGQGGVSGTLQFFAGTDTQTASPYLSGNDLQGVSVNVSGGGSGYSVNDILSVSGGSFSRKAQALVTSVNGGGAVLTVVLLDPGFYTTFPSSPAATTVTPAGGTGCTLDLVQAPGFQSINGVTPRYLRTCYVVPAEEPVYLGNSTQIKPWAFELRRIPNGLGLSATNRLINGADANPANVIYELLTNQEWGLKQLPAKINTSLFSTHAATLKTEGNGFSFLLDRPMQALELLHLLEEQIDGIVFYNQISGLWEMNLARGGYDINVAPLLSSANILSVENVARGAWEDTTNQVRAKFTDRGDSYKETSALAQDAANIRVLQGRVVPADISFPGVKDRVLASSLAWRALRGLSYPLLKATVTADRSMYDTQPGQIVAWTYEIAGESFTRLPMRVMDIDYGELDDGAIRLSLVQDVFQAAAGVFAPPDPTHWGPPSDALRAFAYQVAFEAPRAFTRRDPQTSGEDLDKLWAGARRTGPEVGFRLTERHAAGTPAGAYSVAGTIYQLFLVGSLQSSMAVGSAVPLTSLVVVPGPDSRDALEALVVDTTDAVDLGTNLVNLILVGTEFMLVSSGQTSGANVQLNSLYRGALDSVQTTHPAGALVYLLSAGGGLADTTIPAGQNVDVKLLPFSQSDELPEGLATVIPLTMANRVRRPYPPSRLSLDGTAWASSSSMEANGAGPETFAVDISDVRRRDYRTIDEVAALTVDASSVFADFPTANTTTHKVAVRNDPAGANTLLFTSAAFAGTQKDIRRIEILKATDGVLPSTLRFELTATHLHSVVSYDSRVALGHNFTPTAALSGQFNFGARAANAASNLYTATTAGTFAFTLSSAFTLGAIEYRLNGGAWLSLIAAGLTTGNILAVAISDTIEVRHTSTDVGALKQLDMNAAGAGQDAYFIPYT